MPAVLPSDETPALLVIAARKVRSAIGATLVKCQSSFFVVGNPSDSKRAIPCPRRDWSHSGAAGCRSKSTRYASIGFVARVLTGSAPFLPTAALSRELLLVAVSVKPLLPHRRRRPAASHSPSPPAPARAPCH